jgi:hypothetical protein
MIHKTGGVGKQGADGGGFFSVLTNPAAPTKVTPVFYALGD